MDVKKLSELLLELMGDGTAEDLAKKMGLPSQSVRNYAYRPSSKPGLDALAKIANYMGISLDELAFRIGVEIKTKPNKNRMSVVTVDDAYDVTKGLNAKSRIDLCARLLAEASTAYNV
jgi:transcriptional regulator with XRE-family HTH domain